MGLCLVIDIVNHNSFCNCVKPSGEGCEKTKGKKDFTQYLMFVPVGKTNFQPLELAEVDFFGG